MLDQRLTDPLAARLWPNPEVRDDEARARRRRDGCFDAQGPPHHAHSSHRPVAAKDLAGSRDHEAKSRPATPTGTDRDDPAVELAHDVVSPSELARAIEESPPEKVLSRGAAFHGEDIVEGGRPRGGRVEAGLDHRIVMAFAALGARCAEPVSFDDVSSVATSYPAFWDDLAALGAAVEFEAA